MAVQYSVPCWGAAQDDVQWQPDSMHLQRNMPTEAITALQAREELACLCPDHLELWKQT